MANKVIGNFRGRFWQQILSSSGLKAIYMGCTFLTSLVLARWFGAAEFGIYTYTVSWSYLLGVFSTVGLDNLLVREVAVYKSKGNWGLLRGILSWASLISVSVGLLIATLGIAIAYGTGMTQDPPLFTAFCLAISSLPFIALRSIRRGAMQGLQQVTLGLIPEMLIAPIVILFSILFALAIAESVSAVWCVGIYTLVTAATLAISMSLLGKSLPPGVSLLAPQYQPKQWLASILPLMLIEGIYIINTKIDILMLGSLQSVADAGIYVPVSHGAQLINFVPIAISSTLAPKISSLYAAGKLTQLEGRLVRTAKLAFFSTLLIATGFITFSSWYLNLFGNEFTAGANSLIILSLGQLMFSLTGLCGLLLNMTGNEKYTAITGGGSAVLNTFLNYLFISRWGIIGAAISTSISLLLMNICNLVLVKRKLGIKSTAIGI